MASSSSSSAIPSFSFIPQETEDVFISFRGEDTRYTFTAHLLAALGRLKIRTYVDYKLGRGDEISPTLLRAIEQSKVSVVILSKNYANSKWCLEELVKIMECRRTKGQIVIPVFYYVDPSDVRNQTGIYADAFAKHEQRFKGNKDPNPLYHKLPPSLSNPLYLSHKYSFSVSFLSLFNNYISSLSSPPTGEDQISSKVQKWRDSLREVANLSGWDCLVNRMESQLVEDIAEDVLRKLSCLQKSEQLSSSLT